MLGYHGYREINLSQPFTVFGDHIQHQKEIPAKVKRRITNLSGGVPKGKLPSQEICLLFTGTFQLGTAICFQQR